MRLATNHKRTKDDMAQEDKKGVEIPFEYFNDFWIFMSFLKELNGKSMEIQYLAIGSRIDVKFGR